MLSQCLHFSQKYTVPTDWPYERARELFKDPEVTEAEKLEVRTSSYDLDQSWNLGFPQRLEEEKSQNMKKLPKSIESCYHSWNFAPELYQICIFFATTKKLSTDVGSCSPYFPNAFCTSPQMQNREEILSWKV